MTEREYDFLNNYSEITENIATSAAASGRKPNDITLLAATKTVPAELINFAIANGIKYIGENRVQEFLSKNDEISSDAHRHFIGHLQTNKVKDIIGKTEMIESVHSLKLAAEISKQSEKHGIVTDVLLEINIGNEESKSGFGKAEIESKLYEISKLSNLRVRGLMAIPPICEKSEENRKYFSEMYKLFIDIGAKKSDNIFMDYLSMGMSDDYAVAIEEGANIVRIGTALFGKRAYK